MDEKEIEENIDIYDKASIVRDKYTKKATLSININTDWEIYAGKDIQNINSTSIAEGNKKGDYPLNTAPNERAYFKLITDEGSAFLSEEHLPMAGGYNFRDMGGLKNKEGKRVKWGQLFRTDDLVNLTKEDLNYLSSIPIHTIIDFRNEEEVSIAPDKLPESVKNYYNLSIDPGSLRDLAKKDLKTKEEIIEAMKSLYKLFINDSNYVNTYKEFFQYIQSSENLPIIFHCSAGKDRTGFGAAMLLLALDLPLTTVMEDYLASNYYLGDKYKPLFDINPVNKYMYTIMPEYLETALKEINTKFGSIDNFLTKELHIDKIKLKEKFLF